MKPLLLAAAISLTIPGYAPLAPPQDVQGTWTSSPDNVWTRNGADRWLSIQLERGGDEHGFSVAEQDVPALADRRGNGPLHFTLRRDAGSFDFTGEMRDGRGSGRFHFTPDQTFVSGMGSLGYPDLSTDDVWRFAMFDITREYATGFRTAGYKLDSEDLIRTKIHGATPAFAQAVKNEGLGQPPVDDLIKMRIHGVTPEFVKQMHDLGYTDLPIDRLVEFRVHGVTPEFVKSFNDLGYRKLAGDDLVKMRIHGVSPDLVKALNDLGYKNVAIEDLVRLRIHGVTPDYIKQMRDVGYGKEDVDQLVAFRIHGVDAEFVRTASAHGFKNLSADDLVDLKIHAGRWLKGYGPR